MKRFSPTSDVKDSADPYIEQKHVVLCRSGIQLYHKSEVEAFITEDNKPAVEREWYREYRPANVVVRAKSKCGNLPVTKEHPFEFVNPDNWKELCGGTTGKAVDVVALDGESEGEIGLESDITFYDKSLYEYYSENKEVSLGYMCEKHFVPNPDELGYDILLDEITEVNHLAITRSGRGGSSVAIIDSMIGGLKPMRTGIFTWLAGKRQKDSNPKVTFGSDVFAALKKSKGTTDKELEDELRGVFDSCALLKDCEQKTMLLNMIRDCYDHRDKALANERELIETFDSMYVSISGDSLKEIVDAVKGLGGIAVRTGDSKDDKKEEDSDDTKEEDSDDKKEEDSDDKKEEDSDDKKEEDSDDKKEEDSDDKKDDKKDDKACDSTPVTRAEVVRIVADSLKDLVPELVKSALGLSDGKGAKVEGGVVDSGVVNIERDYSTFLD